MTGASGQRDTQSRLAEIVKLSRAIDLKIAGQAIAHVRVATPATLLGQGKVEQCGKEISASESELVIVNAQLTPGQQRNLERSWHAKVLDRTGLILEIFGRRAQTREGRLQVDLAHLQYQKSRLVRSWTHLERQRGGGGFMGGPGETQIESDRRVIQERITSLERQLEQVRRTRGLHRSARRRVPYPVIALVGYTNAGKSTLFNRLTDARVVARNQLFATLDPTMRQITLPHGRKVILSDTVGFVSDLPTGLVEAFRATLEEVTTADLIVHVRDISHVESDAQADDVLKVLSDLGIDDENRRKVIEVWNKSDLLEAGERTTLGELSGRNEMTAMVSATTGEGTVELLALLEDRIGRQGETYQVVLPASDGAGAAWLYRHGEVLDRQSGNDGKLSLTVRFHPSVVSRAQNRFLGQLSPALAPPSPVSGSAPVGVC